MIEKALGTVSMARVFNTEDRDAMKGFKLLSENRADKVWAALVLLTRFEFALRGDSFAKFLVELSKEARFVGYKKHEPSMRYCKVGLPWTEDSVIKALHLAISQRHLVHHLEHEGKAYFLPVRPRDMGRWKVRSLDLPYRPEWKYVRDTIPYKRIQEHNDESGT